jgi:predicted permease
MFAAILLGAFIAKRGQAGDNEIVFLNTLCFRYLLSLHVFNSVLSVDFYSEFNPRLVLTFIIVITALFLASWLVFSLAIKDFARRCIYIVTSYRSNNIIYALPLAANLFGPAGVKAAAMLIPFTIIFFNFFTVITMVCHRQKIEASLSAARLSAAEKNTALHAALKKCAFEIITNPLIIGSSMGILFSVSRFPLPSFLRNGVNSIAQSATPISLILLGTQIKLKSLSQNIRPVLAAMFLRLILVPSVLVPLSVFLGFRGPELSALAVAFAAPPAVTNLIMARNYKVAPELAAQTVYLSTLASMFSIFAMIAILRALRLF